MPPLDHFSVISLSESVNNIIPPKTFFLDKIFKRGKTHLSKTIQVDIRVGNKKLAPFVKRGQPGKTLDKLGYKTQHVEPPHIRMKKFFGPSEVKHIRGVGEPIHTSGGSVSAGEKRIAEEQKEMKDESTRRKEWMALQAVLGGFSYVDAEEGLDFEIDFLMPAANKPTLTGGDLWSAPSTATPGKNIQTWQTLIGKATGKGATMGLGTREVFEAMLDTAEVEKLLNFRRANSGAIDTTQMADDYGVQYRGNLHGTDLWEYNEEYEDDNGDFHTMLPDDTFVLLAPSADYRLHHAITEDMKAGMVAMEYFSKMWQVEDPSGEWILVETNPLPVPHQPAAAVAAKVL